MDRWAESDARDLMPSSGGPHHAAGSAPMLQGHESAVIRKRRRPVLDRARNIRQIVVRGSRTDPPTVSGAKEEEDRRPAGARSERQRHYAVSVTGYRPGIDKRLGVETLLHGTGAAGPVGAGFPQSPARSTPGSSTETGRPSPSPRQANPRQRVKAPPPADRPSAGAIRGPRRSPGCCTRGGRGRRRHRYPSPGRSPRAPRHGGDGDGQHPDRSAPPIRRPAWAQLGASSGRGPGGDAT